VAVAHTGPWTEEDLLALPPDDQRYELLEGALIVNPPPSFTHQRASFLLARVLDAAAPDHFVVVEAVGVRVPDGLFIPDVLVADRSKASEDPSGVLPAEVVELVAEVVSPGSRSMDRLTKPSLYARAGIRFYWRIELDEGPSIHAHRLDGDEYVEFAVAGTGQPLEIVEPFQIVVRPDELTR
jgi:Uma2 family endonuclease